ncbi:MAG TPA: CPBP family intramembrane glutamic endopeptidase [Candidatus Acidoferrales bacterium]|nr:CPBP family intramembrane glutamic endopeptidase [Candidatus Acidoferrales bacterium]
MLAPVVAVVVGAAGWRFPFPRIFDRTIMATMALAMLVCARRLELWKLMREGFSGSARESTARFLRGLAVSLAAIGFLTALALAVGAGGIGSFGGVVSRVPKYLLSAIVIAAIEEAFFRAFLLGGMKADLGARIALIASAAIYALAHLVRSPAKFYVAGYSPMAGLATLAHSGDQLGHPATAIPVLFGLFLLGIVLGEAFLLTGSVYLSMGLHAGFVLGAKLWPKIVLGRGALPWWIAGAGPVPMIGGAAAWTVAIVVLLLLKPLAGVRRQSA